MLAIETYLAVLRIAASLAADPAEDEVAVSCQSPYYIDKLLFNLEANGIGCFIGKMFAYCANVSCNASHAFCVR